MLCACACAGAAPAKKEKKPRKKKDPNAPKKALSAFMYFSNANRERVKTSNPGIPFGQVGSHVPAVVGSVPCVGAERNVGVLWQGEKVPVILEPYGLKRAGPVVAES